MRKNTVSQRLNIAKGQVEALKRLIEDDTDCRKIIEQFSAADAALKSAIDCYLNDHLNHCLSELDDNTKRELERVTKTLIKNR